MALVVVLSGCARLPPREIPDEPPLVSVIDSPLYQEIEKLGLKYQGDSGFELLSDGMEALAVRLRLIQAAQVSLDVQYYIWHDDLVGQVMANRLLKAADRGVQIRLLLDDLDTSGKDKPLRILSHHPNIDVRLFNPFPDRAFRWTSFIRDGARLNRRMHNKSLTADGALTVVGGRNIGDEYFDASRSVRFSDIDVLAVGPVALSVRAAFNNYWKSRYSYPIEQLVALDGNPDEALYQFRQRSEAAYEKALDSEYAEAVRARWDVVGRIDESHKVNWGDWQLFADKPEKLDGSKVDAKTHIAPHLGKLLNEADTEILLISPYIVPGDAFTRFLAKKVAEGISVSIMTNSLASNDVAMVHAGYKKYREPLLKSGVRLYEFKPTSSVEDTQRINLSWLGSTRASLHGKYFILDREQMFVGSFNMDPRSVALNTEMGILYQDKQTASQIASSFESYVENVAYELKLRDGDIIWETTENGKQVILDTEPQTTWWQRVMLNILSWVAPESQL